MQISHTIFPADQRRRQGDASWLMEPIIFQPNWTQQNTDSDDVWKTYADYWLCQSWAALSGLAVPPTCKSIIVRHSDLLYRPEAVISELTNLGFTRIDDTVHIEEMSCSEQGRTRQFHKDIIASRKQRIQLPLARIAWIFAL